MGRETLINTAATNQKQQSSSMSYTVEQLISVNPYNPDILPDLENYVNEQALMAMPAPDFSLCLYLIPERVTARFRQFWDEAAKSRQILEVVPGFEEAIQAYAIHVLSLTYQKIPKSVLAEAINVEGQSLDKFIEHHVANSGWVIEKNPSKGQLIVLPQNEFNHPELKKSNADSVPLDKITRILPILG
ncbi:hypothetical protein RD792_014508 [Penstemon davidsonii]|uniref:CSN8/PSMD8/EIF3K domain-containing protein n=1 Tax=Penstemon davidsonii TaxID=160366 RepID=A0ABR0CPI1_9LAMI|nr:hypothetical protein RD792_014508 [Penstemon davidsonii]